MDMVDMKMPVKTTEEMEKTCAPCLAGSSERWPYGLVLRFEKEQIDKLPSLTNYEVGDKVMVTAEATVTAIRISERQDGESDHSVELQIKKIACEPAMDKPMEQMSPKEYRKARLSA
ncbi:MAG: hypothetical protein EHM41_13785 [Chloroflexi bacterium]|nr:MAG: hypothetical protein EHM41_13785 [Chloroflexota bacterium]